jgi:hypothetical protein
MKKTLLYLFSFSYFFLQAQHEGNTWRLCYSGSNVPIPSEVKAGFVDAYFGKTPYPKLERNLTDLIDPNQCRVSINNTKGEIIIFYDGKTVYNKFHQPMKGGDTINFNFNPLKVNGANVRQGAIILPLPSQKDKYALIHSQTEYYNLTPSILNIATMRLFLSIIDMNEDNGLGQVTMKKQLILEDTLSSGQLTAVKHANGRDWWVIALEESKNAFYKLLLTPNGITINDKQIIGENYYGGGGQTVFSPDGKYYATYDPEKGEVYDFDRCTGTLSNFRKIAQPDKKVWGNGAAISPNSRYLYTSIYTNLYQYDLWAKDIESSKKLIATWDGFKNELGLSSHFNLAQLAPNGKIYISCAGAIQYLHVIEEPDKEGAACKFVHRGLILPSYHSYGLPNHPNFALGALKGSPCDTLHSVGVEDTDNEEIIKIYPNPTQGILYVQINNDNVSELIIRDISGRILKQANFNSQIEISTDDIPNGLVFCEIRQGKQLLEVKRIVVLH